MRKQSFTLVELLTVIAIMAILAGILMPVLGSARARARTASCSSNQSQVSKILSIEMDKTDNKLYSGTSFPDALNTSGITHSQAGWSVYLYEKNLVTDFKALRCSEVPVTVQDNDVSGTSAKQVFGIAKADDDYFNFKGTKMLRDANTTTANSIAPSALLLGGCSIYDGKQFAMLNFASAADSDATGRTGAIHNGSGANFFYLDGHVENLDIETIVGKYYPVSAGTHSVKIEANASGELSNAKWLSKSEVVF